MTHFIYKNVSGHEHARIILDSLGLKATHQIGIAGVERQH